MRSRSLEAYDKLEIGLQNRGPAESRSGFFSSGMISSDLNTFGTVAVEKSK